MEEQFGSDPQAGPKKDGIRVLLVILLVIVSTLAVAGALLVGFFINIQGARLERLSARQDMLSENFSTLAAKLAEIQAGAASLSPRQ